jgi:hypothetical protein
MALWSKAMPKTDGEAPKNLQNFYFDGKIKPNRDFKQTPTAK